MPSLGKIANLRTAWGLGKQMIQIAASIFLYPIDFWEFWFSLW